MKQGRILVLAFNQTKFGGESGVLLLITKPLTLKKKKVVSQEKLAIEPAVHKTIIRLLIF